MEHMYREFFFVLLSKERIEKENKILFFFPVFFFFLEHRVSVEHDESDRLVVGCNYDKCTV